MGKSTSFSALLEKAEVSTKKKSKKAEVNHPVIKLDKSLSRDLRGFVKQKKLMKEAETAMRLAGADLLEYCQEYADERGFKGRYEPTYSVVADDGTKVLFVQTDKFSVPQDAEDLKQVQRKLGAVYEDCIEKHIQVVMKSEVLEDRGMQRELEKLLGDDFSRFFEVVPSWRTVKGFKEKVYDIAKVDTVLEKIRSFFPQAKASLKG